MEAEKASQQLTIGGEDQPPICSSAALCARETRNVMVKPIVGKRMQLPFARRCLTLTSLSCPAMDQVTGDSGPGARSIAFSRGSSLSGRRFTIWF
jgi:hypothetical protein